MNIIKREMRANLKSLLIWCGFIIFFILSSMIKFDTVSSNSNIDQIMTSIPDSMRDIMGIKNITLSNISGYISALTLYLYLILTIHSALLGSSIISKEERDRTAEFLFSFPISRSKVLLMKIIAAFINILIVNLLTLGILILSSYRYTKDENFYTFIALIFIAIFLLQMIFLSVGMLIASITKRYRKSGNISVGILIISYALAFLKNMINKWDFLNYITPFKYFDSNTILSENILDIKFVILAIIIIALGIGITFYSYPKRDLQI